jgi:hypothetical protein
LNKTYTDAVGGAYKTVYPNAAYRQQAMPTKPAKIDPDRMAKRNCTDRSGTEDRARAP